MTSIDWTETTPGGSPLTAPDGAKWSLSAAGVVMKSGNAQVWHGSLLIAKWPTLYILGADASWWAINTSIMDAQPLTGGDPRANTQPGGPVSPTEIPATPEVPAPPAPTPAAPPPPAPAPAPAPAPVTAPAPTPPLTFEQKLAVQMSAIQAMLDKEPPALTLRQRVILELAPSYMTTNASVTTPAGAVTDATGDAMRLKAAVDAVMGLMA